MNGFLYIVLLVILLCLSAFFSGSEAALFSMSRDRVERLRASSPAGRTVGILLSSPRRLLITVLLGNLIVNVFSTSIVTSASMRIFGERGVGFSFLLMSFLILGIGEIIPKTYALNSAERFSSFAAYPLRFFHRLFFPLCFPLSRFSDSLIGVLRDRLGSAREFFSNEELLTAVDIGKREGYLGEFEHDILSNILEFREKIVRDIMTPSIEVFSLPAKMSREDLLDRVRRRGFSRIPIHGDSTDEIRGILHVKDLARLAEDEAHIDIISLLRPPYYVLESTHISELFKGFVQRKMHLAIVIDEYGSFVGVVTMEDIMEELIGEIRDHREPKRQDYMLVDDRRIIVLGTMEIEKFNEVFGTDIEDAEHATIAGYLIGAAGKIPRAGETIAVGDLRFHVISSRPNRIRKMRIEKI